MMNRAALYVMQEMKRLADGVGEKLVVVYIPLYFSEHVESLPTDLAGSAEQSGIILVDMADRFNEFKQQGIEIPIPGDGHLNETSHAAIGEEVAERLARSGDPDG
jgi:hypothetical protein